MAGVANMAAIASEITSFMEALLSGKVSTKYESGKQALGQWISPPGIHL